ncbi:MAG: hypothetical protein VXX59_01100 [Candidatus Thermoplasmatota archaeon]|jgi:hypothetical protein|nr:hypothetical protein [Euryarchaeota archaeon]MEC7169392.1 hypothetical protein [Candidatus Thermoplasmatota archaeon]GIR34381.1 MAG: hypothetical protein CM15mP48_0650 [Candidatus Poseidoniales archaeon]MEC7197860.1 hypothetical protein [Candidatus Thermoplasmatota archaeon]MEC7639819.1 hypothetical protein [Candidatus Thermoplasmatota archaeon]
MIMAPTELAVSVDSKPPARATPLGVLRAIWNELSGGIGPWGALRPAFSILLAIVPFLYLGQHFNRQHKKGVWWFVLQLPLLLTIVLWPLIYAWSIIDSWWVSNGIVSGRSS